MNDMEKLHVMIMDRLSQSEAAALAVLLANLKEQSSDEGGLTEEAREVLDLVDKLEQLCLESIRRNDGKVVYWIGVAAKQLNPLLS